jgi:soluble P-type ATPase
MNYAIPGQGSLTLKTIILDLNGTLSVGGVIPEGVKPRLDKLKEMGFRVLFFTGNTRGDADALAADLGIEWKLAKNADAKRYLAQGLDPETCVAVGNGLIDVELLKAVKLAVATLQSEGVHLQALLVSDIVVPNINDALDLFIDSQRLIATLRK